MKSAPDEIRLIIDEVETLSLILEDIDRDMQQQLFLDPRTKATVMRSYRHCRNVSEALRALVAELEDHLAKGKKKGSFKAAIKQDKMESFRKKLESAKATMLLANQCYDRAVQGQNWQSHERDMLEIRCAMSMMPNMAIVNDSSNDRDNTYGVVEQMSDDEERPNKMPATGPSSQPFSRRIQGRRITNQQYRRLFGLVDLVTYSRGSSTSTSISVTLPTWIYARNFQIHLTKSYQGWDQSFRTYRTVSCDAQVFKLSADGNMEGLQQLFKSGRASPFEIDSYGWTPLHVRLILIFINH